MRKTQRVFVFLTILAIAATLLADCAQSGAPSPTPGQTIPEPALTPGQTTPEPALIPAETSGEPDILTDVLKVRRVASGYSVQPILVSAFGLPKQLALLPNGDIVISDTSFWRILLLSGGILRTLVSGEELKMTAVAAMPDGRICYRSNDELILLDPDTGATEILGTTPPRDNASALTADSDGNVYAATSQGHLYRFTLDGNRTIITDNLPFADVDYHITDLDVTADGSTYVSGYNRCVSVSPTGDITVIADDLNYEPTWCEVTQDGSVYIKDIWTGIRCFDPRENTLTPVTIKANTGVSDFLAHTTDELVFIGCGSQIVYRYHLATAAITPLFHDVGNNRAFAVADNETVFFATASMPPALKSHIVCLHSDSSTHDITKLTFSHISSADVDKENRLCLYADGKFHRLEADGSITIVTPKLSSGHIPDGNTQIAVSPDGLWYCITSNFKDSVQVWCTDKTGKASLLPIAFNRSSFGDAYKVRDARIDVGDDGRIAIIVTAVGSKGQGPYHERVYRAAADGTNLTEIASFTEDRIGGIVDIAIGPDNNVYVKICKGPTGKGGSSIYQITSEGTITEMINFAPGRDPACMDVASTGNVWFNTTVGVFRIVRNG